MRLLIILLSFCFVSCEIDAQLLNNNIIIDQALTEPVEPLMLNSDNVFFFDASRQKNMFKIVDVYNANKTIGVPLGYPTADADAVGFFYDIGPNAFKATAASNTVTPAIKFNLDNRNNSLYFSGTKYLRIKNSTSSLKFFHKQNQAFSICVWAKKATDGTVMVLFSNTAGSSLNNGIYLSTTAANKLNFLVVWGSSGNTSINYTSTATFTVADGWLPIIVTVSGAGATAGTLRIGDKTPETFNVDNEGSNNAATGLMTWGATSSLASFFNGYMDCFGAMNRVMTSDEITDYKAFEPETQTANFLVKEIEYDFNDATNMFSDVAMTTQVTNGNSIAAVKNKAITPNFGDREDYLIQNTSGSRPVYNSNVVNGKGVAAFDGTDDNLNLNNVTERGGAFVIFVVASNEDMTDGSHYIYSDPDAYLVETGDSYSAPPAVSPYSVWHFEVGISGESVSKELSSSITYQIFALQREDNDFRMYTLAGVSARGVSVNQWQVTKLGDNALTLPAWNMDGNYCKFIKYSGYMTYNQIQTIIEDLNREYNP